jgi:hypothetical protein
MLLLFFFGQAPFIMGAYTACLLSCFLIAYFYCREYPLGAQSSPLVGLILGWIGLLAYQDFLGPCFMIFSMLYLTEFLFSFAKKITFRKGVDKIKRLWYTESRK